MTHLLTQVRINLAARLWPLPLLIWFELLLLIWLVARDAELLVTPFSLAVAMLIMSVGLTPALLQPSAMSKLAGSIAVLLAGVVLVPFEPLAFDGFSGALFELPAGALLRIFNGALFGPVLLEFTTVFPVPRPLSKQLISACYLAIVGLLIGMAFSSASWGRVLALTLAVAGVVLVALSIGRMAQASRISPAAQLVLLSALAAQLPLVIRALLALGGVVGLAYDVVLAAQLVLPIGLSLAILRYDLFGIDALQRRGVLYALVSGGLLAGYLAATVGGVAALVSLIPSARGVAAVLGLLASAAVFGMIYTRAWRSLERWFYPERARFAPAITDAQSRLADVIDRASITAVLTDILPARLGAEWAELIIPPLPEVLPHKQQEQAWSAPLGIGQQHLGRIWIGPRYSGLAYDRDECAQLDSLAHQASLALANADLVAELRSLNQHLEQRVAAQTAELLDRERLLAINAERQRIARNLHDSVTQALFSLSLSTRALRRLAERDPPAVVESLADQEATTQQALAEMRDLLQQLRAEVEPSPDGRQVDLSDLLGSVCRSSKVTATLSAPVSVLVSAKIAAELVYITREALHNVAQHSGVYQATLQLRTLEDWIELTIADHGRGFEAQRIGPAQLGLRGMHERAVALGGTLMIESVPSAGATLRVRVPVKDTQA